MFFEDSYLWFKALHVISVMAWMAGLFYLPRLYVYHTTAKIGSELSETLKVMERRLLRAIMYPAMVMSLIFGTLLLLEIEASFIKRTLHKERSQISNVSLSILSFSLNMSKRSFF